ncbi:MAG: hypothetical protein ABL986_14245 [Vicinamibacterales bacterium]
MNGVAAHAQLARQLALLGDRLIRSLVNRATSFWTPTGLTLLPIAVDAMANTDDTAPATEVDVQQIADVGPLRALDRGRGSNGATQFRPGRAKTRVTVDRGRRRSAALICPGGQAVSAQRDDGSFQHRGDAAVDAGGNDPSLRPFTRRDGAIHFATVPTLIPSALGDPGLRPALLYPHHDQLPHFDGGLRVTMHSHREALQKLRVGFVTPLFPDSRMSNGCSIHI